MYGIVHKSTITLTENLQPFIKQALREDIAYEASIRLANSVSTKYDKYHNRYEKLEHVQGKPFVLAVAPFDEPYFWIQRLDGITNVLYAAKLGSVRKENGTEFPLGFFLDAGMAEVSAVIFSNVGTYGKVVALANDKDSVNCFVTARHGHANLNYYTDVRAPAVGFFRQYRSAFALRP